MPLPLVAKMIHTQSKIAEIAHQVGKTIILGPIFDAYLCISQSVIFAHFCSTFGITRLMKSQSRSVVQVVMVRKNTQGT